MSCVKFCNASRGKVGALRKKFQAVSTVRERLGYEPYRLMTDVTGEPFWTLVAESSVESIDDFFAMEEKVMGEDEARQAMSGYHDLMLNGTRQILKTT